MKYPLRIKPCGKDQQPRILYVSAELLPRVNWKVVKRLGFEVQTEFAGAQVSEEFVNNFPHLVIDGLSSKILQVADT